MLVCELAMAMASTLFRFPCQGASSCVGRAHVWVRCAARRRLVASYAADAASFSSDSSSTPKASRLSVSVLLSFGSVIRVYFCNYRSI